MGRFEILEHTADVGIAAWGDTLEEAFEQASRGLADICGTWHPGAGPEVVVTVSSDDVEAALVDWLNEILWLQDSRDAVLSGVDVARVDETGATGRLTMAPRDSDLDGTAVKAVTYHQLHVQRDGEGWCARVFVDV